MRDYDLQRMVWSMYYAGCFSMMLHPGNVSKVDNRENLKLSLDFCADLADRMFDRYVRRFSDLKE